MTGTYDYIFIIVMARSELLLSMIRTYVELSSLTSIKTGRSMRTAGIALKARAWGYHPRVLCMLRAAILYQPDRRPSLFIFRQNNKYLAGSRRKLLTFFVILYLACKDIQTCVMLLVSIWINVKRFISLQSVFTGGSHKMEGLLVKK